MYIKYINCMFTIFSPIYLFVYMRCLKRYVNESDIYIYWNDYNLEEVERSGEKCTI